jgi:hypothetical protein
MKKLLIASLMLVTVAASAQDFRIGVKGTFYSTWLFNSNIADQGEAWDYAATFSPSFGASTALFFTNNLAVSLDILYAANNQKLEPANADFGYKTITRVKYLDLPLLLKISSDGGAYVEIGPQFSLLMGANEDFTTNVPSIGYVKKDFKNDFSSFGIAPILGFGVDIQANDNLFINVGLRFGYGITDATKKFPENDTAEHSAFSALAHTSASDGDYSYKKTNRAFGGFTLGVIYKVD